MKQSHVLNFGLIPLLFLTANPVTTKPSSPLVDALDGKGFDVKFPGNPLYESTTQAFNRRYVVKPAAIAFPTTVQQVAQIVSIGHQTNHKIVARSGGHSYTAQGLGTKDGAIVIDMSSFNSFVYNTSDATAVIGVGNRLGNIVLELNKHGKAIPHGTCSYVGWGGHATLGGYGFTSRLWGLSLDAIEEMQVVLANGTVSVASPTQNRHLFWGLRGAAPYLGIVTLIKVRTFSAPSSATIFAFNWQLSVDQATFALIAFQNHALTTKIPSELGIQAVFTRSATHGTVAFRLAGGWYGPSEQLNNTINPLLDAIVYPPASATFDVGDYLHSAENLAGGSLDTSVPGGRDTFYAKSLLTPSSKPLTMNAIRAFLSTLATEGFAVDLGWWFIQVDLFGGQNSAINEPLPNDTAFPHRNALFGIQLYGSSPENVAPYPTSGFSFLDNAVNAILKNSPPHWGEGAYLNYIDDRFEGHAGRLYYKSNFGRLLQLKRVHDPTFLFDFPKGWVD